ncbi:hypothetical protein SSABA_v1c06180 [Spiroplasma sabaudiense Ar-1343]|uniref:Transmembrane protein n=1 Tax=Spiroplasma sabaudiense Ar-1343 TaxID=1276257 RepID=W6AAY6_9MOLU|nr:hypothetical protein [Spiroplasma sabaudiense]AHI54020.1 hypothetical protein SSABA_v1c06180 [Spiroplasma sabaudiense Ar-1343]
MIKKFTLFTAVIYLIILLSSIFVIDQTVIDKEAFSNGNYEVLSTSTGFFNWFGILAIASGTSAALDLQKLITTIILSGFLLIIILSFISLIIVSVAFKKGVSKNIKIFGTISYSIAIILLIAIQVTFGFSNFNSDFDEAVFSNKPISIFFFLETTNPQNGLNAVQQINPAIFFPVLFFAITNIILIFCQKSRLQIDKTQNNHVKENFTQPQPKASETLRMGEDSIDLNSKINRLRSDLAKSPAEMEGFTEESTITNTITQEEEIKPQPVLKEFVTQELNQTLDEQIVDPLIIVQDEANSFKPKEPLPIIEESVYEPILIDPYVKTITPRRGGKQKAQQFEDRGPIGVTFHDPLRGFKRNRDLIKPEYENKIFLGDSDRIWEAIRHANRDILKKHPASLQNQAPQKNYYQPNEAEIEKIKSIYTYDKTIDWGDDA